jgi:translocation and assembly module TamB
MRRALLVAGGGVAALAFLLAAAVAAVLASAPGHEVARRLAVAALERAVDGQVRIGSLDGSLWHAAELRDVEIAMPDGQPVIQAERVTVRYALADLLRRRFVLSHVELQRPTVTLVVGADGHLNIERLFAAGAAPAGGAPPASASRRPLIELRTVRLVGGTVVVREPPDRTGYARERRFEDLDLELRRLRASHPDSAAVVAEIARLAVSVTDPAVRIDGAAGRVTIRDDSAGFELSSLVLSGTTGRASGVVRWGGGASSGRATLDLAADLRRFSFADFRWVAAGMPASGGGRVAVRARLFPNGGSSFSFREADVRTGRTAVRGTAELAVAANGAVHVDTLDVAADTLDLATLVPLLGPMPVAGLVSGHVAGAGALAALNARVDLRFSDEGAPGRAVSQVAGTGVVALGGRDGVEFRHFVVSPADLSLATIAGLAPTITLHGRLELTGTLDGPWNDASFAGTLVHRDGGGPASRLRGTARLALADTVRVSADLAADSLSLDDLSRSYPALELHGTFAGRVQVAGPVTALAIDASLDGPAGRFRARGEVAAGDSGVRLRFAGAFDSLDLSGLVEGAPPSRLSGQWRAELAAPASDTAGALTGKVSVVLASSRVAGVVLSRAGAAVALTGERIEVDTAYLERGGLSLVALGAIGRPGGPAGQLRFAFHADTLATVEPLVAWMRAAIGDSGLIRLAVRGSARATGRIEGTLDNWEVQGDVVADSVTYGSVSMLSAAAGGTLGRSARGLAFHVQARCATLDADGMRYERVRASASGPLDSLRLRVAAAFALGSSVELDGRLAVDSTGWEMRLDKGALTLARRTWTLAGGARIRVTPRWIEADTVALVAPGDRWVRAYGRFPVEAPGDVTVEARGVPLPDLYALVEADTAGIAGVLSWRLHLVGAASEPRIEASATLADGRFGDFLAPLVQGSAEYAGRRLAVRGGLWRGSEQVVEATGTLPLDLALHATEHRQLPGPLQLRVWADSVDLAVFNALTSLVRGVAGQVSADFAVQGTWEDPLFSGSARIAGGAATVPALGARYTGIEARLSLSGSRLTVEEARLRGGSGSLDVGGEVRFETLTRPVLDLTLTAHNFAAFSLRSFAGLTGSGTLSLRGPVVGATLSGRLTVDDGYLAFADLVEKRIVNLDDPEFRAIVDSNLAEAAGLGPSAQSVFLDSLRIQGLTVAMGPDVWLRSHEANIQLAGEFTVAKNVEGNARRYRLDGELRATRGTYRLVIGPTGKEFRVTRGTVRFFGTPDLNPVLDIVADHTVRVVHGNDIVVHVVIGGTLLVPRLSLSSDQRPPLSETEIVSYLLFGRPSADLVSAGSSAGAHSEQAVLQGALAGLAGVVSGELEQTLVGDLGIPVDYIAIRPGGGSVGDIFGSTRVEAGTQIGERTFLTVNAGLCQVVRGLASQPLGASVEYRMTRRWSLEASVEPTVQECRPSGWQIRPPSPYQVGVDLFWQWGNP